MADGPQRGATVTVRVPGRVNVIGEHTDYNALPVLPFALERTVRVVARRRADDTITLRNARPEFPPRTFSPATAATPFGAGDWGDYAKAAVRAVVAESVRRGWPPPPGFDAVVDTDLPAAAGLSSSSALLVAMALAQLAVAGTDVPRLALAELLADAERYVGTLSGGMDQAAILLGEPGHALRLDFFPLRARPVPVPAAAAFVVADSLEPAPKAGAVRGAYNQRVVECRLACAVLAHRLGVDAARLGDLPPGALLGSLPDLLPDGPVDRATLRGLVGDLGRHVPADAMLARPDAFVLRARVRHVLSEAARVAAAEAALRAGDLRALGALLDAAHASMAADYEASTPGVDRLAALARAGGALGARVMGAGFGGAVLALVERAHADAVLAHLDRTFYAPRGAGSAHRFVVTPSMGARVDWLQDVC